MSLVPSWPAPTENAHFCMKLCSLGLSCRTSLNPPYAALQCVYRLYAPDQSSSRSPGFGPLSATSACSTSRSQPPYCQSMPWWCWLFVLSASLMSVISNQEHGSIVVAFFPLPVSGHGLVVQPVPGT